jgi:hypothetical protein
MAHRLLFLSVLVFAALAPACVQSPTVPDIGTPDEVMPLYADVLLNYTEGGEAQICRDGLPPCDMPVGAPCGAPQVLGPPDDIQYTFDADGRIDVGFHCGAILEAGPVVIFATVPPRKTANVFVSQNGLTYEFLGRMYGPAEEPDAGLGQIDAGLPDAGPDGGTGGSRYEFQLGVVDFTSARYIRITDTGGGGTAIDAIQGYWAGPGIPPASGAE